MAISKIPIRHPSIKTPYLGISLFLKMTNSSFDVAEIQFNPKKINMVANMDELKNMTEQPNEITAYNKSFITDIFFLFLKISILHIVIQIKGGIRKP